MHYSTCSIEEYVQQLAGKAAVPGGGGTAALAGALGVALGNMVLSLTEGKKKYVDVQEEVAELKTKLTVLQKELLLLIDKDAEMFLPLSLAYKMPGNTEQERYEKNAAMQAAIFDAATTPLTIIQTCGKALELIALCAQKGSRMAISDAGCGAALCKAAIEAAALNVYINTNAMEDKLYARELNSKTEELVARHTTLAEDIYRDVLDALRQED